MYNDETGWPCGHQPFFQQFQVDRVSGDLSMLGISFGTPIPPLIKNQLLSWGKHSMSFPTTLSDQTQWFDYEQLFVFSSSSSTIPTVDQISLIFILRYSGKWILAERSSVCGSQCSELSPPADARCTAEINKSKNLGTTQWHSGTGSFILEATSPFSNKRYFLEQSIWVFFFFMQEPFFITQAGH